MKKFIYTIILLVIIGTVNLCIIHKQNDHNADAKYVEIINEYILNENGSIDFIHHHKVKLNTYYAIRYLGDDRITYNPKYQKMEIIKSETKMNDGTFVPTPENGYNEVLPRCATKAPSYNHLREMVVTHTGLDIGSVIDFKYSIHTKKDFLPNLMGEEIFANFYPIKKMTVKITIPADKNLNYELFNSTKKVKVKENESTKTFTWKFENIPTVVHESNQSEIGEFSSRLVFSTLKSWEALSEYLKSLTEKSMKIDKKLKTEIKDDLSDETDDLMKIITAQKNINENVGTTTCSPAIYGYKPKSVRKTFYENNGTAFDKSLLLSSYLKFADVKATPIFVSKYNNFSNKVPSLLQFDNFIVLSKDSSGKIYLNPIHEQKNNYSFNIGDKTIFDFNNETKTLTKIQKNNEYKHGQKIILNLNLENDLTLKGDYKLIYSGIYNPYYELYENEENVKKVMNEIIDGTKIDSAECLKMNQYESIIDVKLSSDDTLKIKNDYIRWKLPQLSQSFNNRKISVAQTKRQTPLYLENDFCENYTININLPNSIKCINPDTSINIENKIGIVNIEFQNEKNKITVKRKLFVNKSVILPINYKLFRNLIVIW
ncbi:MAG: DUF3857 domain-containing protein, partial [Candidatus Marinimicrobia bacterium]|nr:DUF3857 domain-containing protein [Candidatus Neomarinimicrobiota bacterium]